MKIISLGMGQKIFEEDSTVRQRMIEYGKIFDELHIVVFTPNLERYNKQNIAPNVFLYPTRSKARILYVFDFLNIVRQIIEKIGNKDLVISTQDPFETGLVGLLLKLRFGLPLQVQIHTDFVNKFFIKHSVLNFIRLLISHLILPYADGVRVVSKKIRDSITDLSSSISILPILTTTNVQSQSIEKPSIFSIITVSRLESEKAISLGIKAFAKFLENGIKSRYVIVGDGSERKRLEKLAEELGVADKVYFVGWQNDISPFYAGADAYLSTSLYEGYGMTLIEASLSGLPIIMTDTGLAGDIFIDGKSALVCKQNDVVGLAEALFHLATDKTFAQKIADSGKKQVTSRQISKEVYLERYKKALLPLLSVKIAGNIFSRVIELVKNMVGHIRLLRFAIGGLSIALAQILLLYILTEFAGYWYLLSSAMSFCFAVITSFLVQKYWAFRDHSKERAVRQFIQFVIVALIGIATNTVSMFFWVDLVHVWYVLAQVFTGAIIMIINFLIYRFVIFKNTYEDSNNYPENR